MPKFNFGWVYMVITINLTLKNYVLIPQFCQYSLKAESTLNNFALCTFKCKCWMWWICLSKQYCMTFPSAASLQPGVRCLTGFLPEKERRQLSQHQSSPPPHCPPLFVFADNSALGLARYISHLPIGPRIREPHCIKELPAPWRELCGCQKPVEWEVTISLHYTVITYLSLPSFTILLSVEAVHFQTALLITQRRHIL